MNDPSATLQASVGQRARAEQRFFDQQVNRWLGPALAVCLLPVAAQQRAPSNAATVTARRVADLPTDLALRQCTAIETEKPPHTRIEAGNACVNEVLVVACDHRSIRVLRAGVFDHSIILLPKHLRMYLCM
jgi:hypothetical protein